MQTMPPTGTAPPAVPGTPLPPPAPGRSRSPLGRLVLSLALFGVGLVAVVDLAGPRVPVSVYFAVPLAVLAAGLVAGAWYGRARGLIGIGVVLSILLASTATAEHHGWTTTDQPVTWRPAGIAQLQSGYTVEAGNATLDLSRLDFTARSTTLDVHVSVGNLTVILPSTVDAQIAATVGMGDATVLGQQWSGIGQSQHTVTDNGPDGPGGGQLTVTATVNVGNLEVRR